MTDYVLEGPKWQTDTITWSFADAANPANYSGIFGAYSSNVAAIYRQTFVDAFTRWASVSGLHFVQSTDSTAVDIRVGWARLPPTVALGLTPVPRSGNFSPAVEIQIVDPAVAPLVQDPELGWVYAAAGATLSQVVTHEIGHALGLQHDADIASIMYPAATPTNRDLDATDIAGIDALYGIAAIDPGSISISGTTAAEGDGGTKSFVFTVSRTGGTAATSIQYATRDGTATAASGDYRQTSGTLVFPDGVLTRTLAVAVVGDTVVEPDETFSVDLSNPTNGASIAIGSARGTILNDDRAPPVAPTAPAAPGTPSTMAGGGPASSVQPNASVYRFFDRSYGTHFFTASASERDQLIATRSDLVYEGIGLAAQNPANADPAAAPVFRFFDTSHGTHFFTASQAEKDQVVATRSDLTFEGVGFYEHTARAQGDIPVYRFFDTAYGTHFYTADVNERTSILTTRPDLKDEGVGFYAPAT